MVSAINNLLSIFFAIWILLIAVSIGQKILSLFNFTENEKNKLVIEPFGIGLGALFHLMWLLGLLGLYKVGFIYSFFILLNIIFFKKITQNISIFLKKITNLNYRKKNYRVFIFVIFIFIICCTIGALTPPFSIDTLAYHLTIPKIYSEESKIVFFPTLHFNMPQGMEMLYLLGIFLYKDTVGLLLNSFCAVLAAASIYFYCKERYSAKTGLIAVLIFYSIPLGVWYLCITGKINLGLYLYTLLAFFSFERWTEKLNIKYLTLAGIFTGLACSIKWTGFYNAFTLMFLALYILVKFKVNFKCSLKYMAYFFSAILITGFPWYLKSFIFTGNPVYPLFTKFFGGKSFSIDQNKLIDTGVFLSLGKDFKSWLFGIYKLIIKMTDFFPQGGFGPLLLIFTPIAFFEKNLKKNKLYFLFFAIYYSFWFLFAHDGMYLMPAVILMCIPAADTISQLTDKTTLSFKIFIYLSFWAWIFLSLAAITNRILYFSPAIFGLEDKESFLRKNSPLYAEIYWMNTNIPVKAIIFSDLSTLYYLNRRFTINGPGYFDYSSSDIQEIFIKFLKDNNIEYFFYVDSNSQKNERKKSFFGHEAINSDFLESKGKLVYKNENCFLAKSLLLKESFSCISYIYKMN